MSGLNKQETSTRKYFWRKSFYVITLIYLLVVSLLAIGAYKLPEFYRIIDQSRVESIKSDIKASLAEKNADAIDADLSQLVAKYNMDLVVLSDKGFGYQTTDTIDLEVLREQINERSLSYESSYSLTVNQENYQIWLAVYQMEPQYFFETVIFLLVISVLILFILLSSLIFTMFKKLIEPIRRLKNNIFKLKSYQFNEVSHDLNRSEYDALSEELSEFTDDLQGKMDYIGMNYTILEKELQAEKEKLIYKDQSIGAMVHNLKNPNSMVSLYLEQALAEAVSSHQVSVLEKALSQNQLLLKEMKEIIQVTHENEVKRQKEKVDIVSIAREILQRFESLLKKKDMLYDIVSPKNLPVYLDPVELKQLIYNIVSNAIQYAPEGSSIDLSIFEEDGQLHIEAYNDVRDRESLDFERIFDLFYSQQGKKEGHGTGVGMYTIKNTVERNHGTCTFEPFDEGVLLKILIPLGAEEDE